jgi:hypothetical protein
MIAQSRVVRAQPLLSELYGVWRLESGVGLDPFEQPRRDIRRYRVTALVVQ